MTERDGGRGIHLKTPERTPGEVSGQAERRHVRSGLVWPAGYGANGEQSARRSLAPLPGDLRGRGRRAGRR